MMPLLLFARACVRESALPNFSAWYESHIPKRLKAPGFISGFRLCNIDDPCEIIALYLIENAAALPSLLAEDLSMRHPALANLPPPPEGATSLTTGVYSFAGIHPKESHFMKTDGTISLEVWDWTHPEQAVELERGYDEMYLEHLLDYPDHTAAFRLKQFEDPVVAYTNRSPTNLTIIENPIEMPASQITQMRLRADKEPLFKGRRTGVYKLLSKHWRN